MAEKTKENLETIELSGNFFSVTPLAEYFPEIRALCFLLGPPYTASSAYILPPPSYLYLPLLPSTSLCPPLPPSTPLYLPLPPPSLSLQLLQPSL
jgi:hypothetical protein